MRQKEIITTETKKTSLTTWIVLIIVFALAFIYTYELFSERSIFMSKSNQCKIEAGEEAKSLREKRIIVLKQKTNPTKQDLAEIEELENELKQNLVSRDDYDYLYNHCLNK